MTTKVDLRRLAVNRTGPTAEPVPLVSRRRHMLTRFVLPGLLLAGFAVLIAYAARDTLSPPRPVTVVPVISSQSDLPQAADTPLFRAAGWIEPRPTPTLVTALAEGVVEKLLVVEGQEVKEGEVVARLVSADARLALDSAEADVALRESEFAGAQANLTAAKTRLDQPIHLRAELADAEAALAKAETELANLPFQLQTAQARQQFARTDLESKQKIVGAVPEINIARAKSELEATSSAVEELLSRQKRLPVEIAAFKDKRDALQLKLQLKTEEVRQAAEAEALMQTAKARLKQAQAARDAARLRLERMEIKAPASGRVLALVARPGMRLNGLNPGSLHDSSTVVTLFEPTKLQVRVDVRLDDVGKVLTGQKVKIETAAVPGRSLDGEVLMATSQADIQKNTLSIKVAVVDPPSTLKPDMLCQVTFLAPPQAANPTKEGDTFRLLMPKQLVVSSGDGNSVWVADRLSGTARLRRIELGVNAGDLVEVVSGLSSSDKLIVGGRDGLKDGDRITVAGEDESMGLTLSSGRPKPPGR